MQMGSLVCPPRPASQPVRDDHVDHRDVDVAVIRLATSLSTAIDARLGFVVDVNCWAIKRLFDITQG